MESYCTLRRKITDFPGTGSLKMSLKIGETQSCLDCRVDLVVLIHDTMSAVWIEALSCADRVGLARPLLMSIR